MKKLIFICFSILVLFSCQQETKKTPETTAVATDSSAIANTIHGFYQWYDKYVQDSTQNVDFIKVVGNHYALDVPLLEKYLASIKSSGFVSADFLDNDMVFYKACEKMWLKEEADGPAIGMDGDKYFCAQDWDINFWTKSPIRINSIGNDKASATLYGTHGESPKEQNFELKKENGQWLLTKIECDMGINSPASATSEQTLVEQLAAFYTGSMPCPNCDAIETLLTLNADEKRTFTLEEEYKGKNNKKVESNGTWTVAGDVVTLNQKSGTSKYQITNDGLVSLNADGSKRDAKSAPKYLLKKVMGE
ncbi:MAG: copper resistance protein NlpE N-terminal domain-containing protein [Sphingobacteriales bacterium]|nr:copper resistance protein NlpE N-terminal domain-containing protein [Sphingobacteriales bacterium]